MQVLKAYFMRDNMLNITFLSVLENISKEIRNIELSFRVIFNHKNYQFFPSIEQRSILK